MTAQTIAANELVERLQGLLSRATPGPWHLCQHLKSVETDSACRCGYRGVVYGPEDEGFAVFQPGHETPRDPEQAGSEPPRYPRPVEIANSQLIVETHNALPDLLATITRLTDELTGVKEQCARIAEGWTSPLRPGTDARLLGHQEAARAIAAAIRSEHHDAARALLGGRE